MLKGFNNVCSKTPFGMGQKLNLRLDLIIQTIGFLLLMDFIIHILNKVFLFFKRTKASVRIVLMPKVT